MELPSDFEQKCGCTCRPQEGLLPICPHKSLHKKLVELMIESFEKTTVLDDESCTDDFWLPRCNFDERREALLEEYTQPPHSLPLSEVGDVLLEANRAMFPGEVLQCEAALLLLNQAYTLLSSAHINKESYSHDFLIDGCTALTRLLRPAGSRISYIHGDFMASVGAVDLLLRLLLHPPVVCEDTLHRYQSVLCVLINYAHTGQRHIAAIVQHPWAMEAAVRVASGQYLCESAAQQLRNFGIDSLNLADKELWTKSNPENPCLYDLQRSALHFVYSVIDYPAAQVKLVNCAMELIMFVCYRDGIECSQPSKRTESLLDYALGCLLCCANNERCLVPLLKSDIVECVMTILGNCYHANESYRACTIIAGIWRLLERCLWQEFLTCEHRRRFLNGSPLARVLPSSNDLRLMHSTLERYSVRMEKGIRTFLERNSPYQIHKYESMKVILWGRLSPFTDLLDSSQYCVRQIGFFALENLTSTTGNCHILRHELGDTFTPVQCSLLSRQPDIVQRARLCLTKLQVHGKISVPSLKSLSLFTFSENFSDSWRDLLLELPLELQQSVTPFNFDYLSSERPQQ